MPATTPRTFCSPVGRRATLRERRPAALCRRRVSLRGLALSDAPGEILCLVTDGVAEATNAAGELYGRARLEALLAGMPPEADPEKVGEAIRRDVERFAVGVEAADDLALLILRWIGP